ncbi:membrane protein insertase YidC [Actinokineospora sp. G85]|uniref:membrane protein insertase YidC n=1 Tax=Actinokineospora sp. G85 TaxID=3406626 RepID=UPI003C75F5F4
MFDVLLYPVSAVLWFWHNAFGSLFGPATGAAWVLAIVFLVCTVRALLIRPAIAQAKAAERARELAPAMAKIKDKHGRDRERMAREIQKLHADNGTSPFAGCLPALVQLPVFFSLYWVLRDFTPGATNQVFDTAGVSSFLSADVFGARLGSWVGQSAPELAAAGTDHAHMLVVGLPLMLLAGLATFLTMRAAQRRATTPMPFGSVLTWVAPLGVLAAGLLFPVPIGVLVYYLTSNVWTLAQQHVLMR